MSTILNGAVSAQINKCTKQQTSDFVSQYTAKNSSLASVISQLATNDVADPLDASESLLIANDQALKLLKVIAQCACRDADYSPEQNLYCDGKDIAQALDFVGQVLSITNDAQEKLNRVMRGEAL